MKWRGCYRLLFLSIVCLNLSLFAAKHIWPLYSQLVNYDLKSQYYLGDPICTADGLRHPELGYASTCMFGNSIPDSDIDIKLEYDTELADFAFLIFVYLTNDAGTIFDVHSYRIDDYDIDLILSYNETHLYLRIVDHLQLTDVTVTSPASISRNQWTPVGIICVDSAFSFLVNTTITSFTAYEDDITLILRGTLRIGSGFLPGSLFTEGYVACLTVYDSNIEITKVESAIRDCHRNDWPVSFLTTLGAVSSLRQCSNETGLYTNVAIDETPDSTLNQIVNIITRSRLECAVICSNDENCLSFTFNSMSRVCGTYSSNEYYSLQYDIGTNYYIRSHLLECC